jgi:AcrR family transcriptional regulator
MTVRFTAEHVIPRKNPAQARSAATVHVILQAAAQILEERGLHGFNTNAVAACAGVSVGSIYQYFPCKEALTAGLIYWVHEDILKELQALSLCTEHASMQDAINTLVSLVVRLHHSRPKLNNILEREEARLPSTPELKTIESKIQLAVATYLRPHLQPHSNNEHDLNLIAFDIVNILRGMLDSESFAAENRSERLHDRMVWAVAGYLDQWANVNPPR